MSTLDGQWTFAYDLTGQLVHAVFASTNPSIPDQDLTYEYDALGNRVRTILNGVTTNYTTNALNQYTTVGATTNRYDLDGNLIEETGPDGTRRYTYDALNRLVQVVTPQGTWKYEYDAFGNRTVTVVDGQRTEYLLDPTGLDNVVAEFDGSDSRTVSYANGLGLEGASGPGGWSYYDFDVLGSTAGVSGVAGGYANRYVYDPFGRSLLSSEAIANPFEFVGRYGVMSDNDGLQFMRARHYDPALGRFTTTDPFLNLGNTNRYRYAENRPTNGIDPLGLWTIDIGVSGGGVIGGTVGIRIGGGTACVYGGSGVTTPGLSGGVTFSPDDPSTGVEIQAQGAVGPGIAGAVYGKRLSGNNPPS
jgi:RHS repeat-associated protein